MCVYVYTYVCIRIIFPLNVMSYKYIKFYRYMRYSIVSYFITTIYKIIFADTLNISILIKIFRI